MSVHRYHGDNHGKDDHHHTDSMSMRKGISRGDADIISFPSFFSHILVKSIIPDIYT